MEVGYWLYVIYAVGNLIKSEGYKNIKCMWYWKLRFSFSCGLRPLNNDVDVLQFVKDVTRYKLVDLYVEHTIDDIEVLDES